MPTTAAFGLPYPAPSAPVQKGSEDIRVLAEAVAGTLSSRGLANGIQSYSSVVTTNSGGDANIPFSPVFNGQPFVTACGGDPNL